MVGMGVVSSSLSSGCTVDVVDVVGTIDVVSSDWSSHAAWSHVACACCIVLNRHAVNHSIFLLLSHIFSVFHKKCVVIDPAHVRPLKMQRQVPSEARMGTLETSWLEEGCFLVTKFSLRVRLNV